MGFRTTGVKLIADVTQYIREIRHGMDATKSLGDEMDSARLKGAKMANEVAGTAKASAAQLDVMRDHVRQLDQQIAATQKNIAVFARGFAQTGNDDFLKVIEGQKKQLRQLVNARNLLPDPRAMEEVGKEMATSAATGFKGRWTTQLLIASSPALLAMGADIGAIIGGAVVGAAGLGGVVGGLVLAGQNARVKSAASALGNTIMADLTGRSAGFVAPTLNAIERIRLAWVSLGPDLDRIFNASSRFVAPLTAGGLKGGQALMKGIADAVQAAEPIINSLRNMMSQAGIATGRLFTTMAGDAKTNAMAVDDLTMALSHLIDNATGMVHFLSTQAAMNREMDIWIDRTRFWLEDHQNFDAGLKHLGLQVDLTADGFAKGSIQAEAYRKATLGTASANDFAVLQQAKMTDAQIASIDASGTYRAAMEKAGLATGSTAAAAVTAKKAIDPLTSTMVAAGRAAAGDRAALTDLSKAMEAQFNPVMALITAQKDFREKQIASAKAVHDHGVKSKEARAADLDLAAAALNLTGKVGALGNTFDGKLTPSMKTTLRAAGLTETQIKHVETAFKNAKKAGDKFDGPFNATTKLFGEGTVANQLKILGEMQAALRAGNKPASFFGNLNKALLGKSGPQVNAAVGGMVPGSSPHKRADNIPAMLTAGEFVHPVDAVDYYGGDFMKAVQQRRIPRNLADQMASYAGGGGVWPVNVNARNTRVPSVKEAMAAAMPPVPTGGRTDKWIIAAARSLVGAIRVISAYRPGARTSNGNVSYHALGRAVDFEPRKVLAQKWNNVYKARTKELISPWRSLDIHNGQDYYYSAGLHAQHSGGNAHVHIAMGTGGVINEPVYGVGASGRSYSFAEAGPEVVMPIGGGGGRGGGNTTINVNVAVGPLAHPAEVGRQVVNAIQSYERGSGSSWRS